jgi:hypothetical protein
MLSSYVIFCRRVAIYLCIPFLYPNIFVIFPKNIETVFEIRGDSSLAINYNGGQQPTTSLVAFVRSETRLHHTRNLLSTTNAGCCQEPQHRTGIEPLSVVAPYMLNRGRRQPCLSPLSCSRRHEEAPLF